VNAWCRLFTHLLTACAKGILINVKTTEGGQWSTFLPSFNVVTKDHLSLSGGHDLQYDELLSIEIPEMLSAGSHQLFNDIDLCLGIAANTPGFLVELREAKHAPFSGKCIQVTRRDA
jgi:hypothetical protein